MNIDRFTDRPWLAIPLLAAIATVLTFTVVHVAFPGDGYIHALFFDRSWIQYATTLCFWLTVASLFHRHMVHLRERAAFHAAEEILGSREFGSSLIWSSAGLVRERFTNDENARFAESLVFTRIVNALDRLRKTQSTAALEEYFRTRSEVDAEELDTNYSAVRYLVWLIPTLGFIGTVTGIGAGIAGFGNVIQNATGFAQVRESLPEVTQLLGTAFDTTLLALGFSVIVMFQQSHVLREEERMLEELDTLCIDGVCALFEEHTSKGDEIVTAVNGLGDLVLDGMHGDRAALAQVLRDELPARISAAIATQIANATATVLQQMTEVAEGTQSATLRTLVDELPKRIAEELATRLRKPTPKKPDGAAE